MNSLIRNVKTINIPTIKFLSRSVTPSLSTIENKNLPITSHETQPNSLRSRSLPPNLTPIRTTLDHICPVSFQPKAITFDNRRLQKDNKSCTLKIAHKFRRNFNQRNIGKTKVDTKKKPGYRDEFCEKPCTKPDCDTVKRKLKLFSNETANFGPRLSSSARSIHFHKSASPLQPIVSFASLQKHLSTFKDMYKKQPIKALISLNEEVKRRQFKTNIMATQAKNRVKFHYLTENTECRQCMSKNQRRFAEFFKKNEDKMNKFIQRRRHMTTYTGDPPRTIPNTYEAERKRDKCKEVVLVKDQNLNSQDKTVTLFNLIKLQSSKLKDDFVPTSAYKFDPKQKSEEYEFLPEARDAKINDPYPLEMFNEDYIADLEPAKKVESCPEFASSTKSYFENFDVFYNLTPCGRCERSKPPKPKSEKDKKEKPNKKKKPKADALLMEDNAPLDDSCKMNMTKKRDQDDSCRKPANSKRNSSCQNYKALSPITTAKDAILESTRGMYTTNKTPIVNLSKKRCPDCGKKRGPCKIPTPPKKDKDDDPCNKPTSKRHPCDRDTPCKKLADSPVKPDDKILCHPLLESAEDKRNPSIQSAPYKGVGVYCKSPSNQPDLQLRQLPPTKSMIPLPLPADYSLQETPPLKGETKESPSPTQPIRRKSWHAAPSECKIDSNKFLEIFNARRKHYRNLIHVNNRKKETDLYFLHPQDNLNQKICEAISTVPKVELGEQSKQMLAEAIRKAIGPVIEKEFLKYEEVKAALERMEKRLALTLSKLKPIQSTTLLETATNRDPANVKYSWHKVGNVEINENYKKPQISDPKTLIFDHRDPIQRTSVTAPPINRDGSLDEPNKGTIDSLFANANDSCQKADDAFEKGKKTAPFESIIVKHQKHDPCKEKEDACKKEDQCKKEEQSCDPCIKPETIGKVDPCNNPYCKTEESPCGPPRPPPCEDPCAKGELRGGTITCGKSPVKQCYQPCKPKVKCNIGNDFKRNDVACHKQRHIPKIRSQDRCGSSPQCCPPKPICEPKCPDVKPVQCEQTPCKPYRGPEEPIEPRDTCSSKLEPLPKCDGHNKNQDHGFTGMKEPVKCDFTKNQPCASCLERPSETFIDVSKAAKLVQSGGAPGKGKQPPCDPEGDVICKMDPDSCLDKIVCEKENRYCDANILKKQEEERRILAAREEAECKAKAAACGKPVVFSEGTRDTWNPVKIQPDKMGDKKTLKKPKTCPTNPKKEAKAPGVQKFCRSDSTIHSKMEARMDVSKEKTLVECCSDKITDLCMMIVRKQENGRRAAPIVVTLSRSLPAVGQPGNGAGMGVVGAAGSSGGNENGGRKPGSLDYPIQNFFEKNSLAERSKRILGWALKKNGKSPKEVFLDVNNSAPKKSYDCKSSTSFNTQNYQCKKKNSEPSMSCKSGKSKASSSSGKRKDLYNCVKEKSSKKKDDPCKKGDSGKKKEDPCKKKDDASKKKEDPCKKKEDPCKKKDDASKKKEDPCKKKDDGGKKMEDPCKKKEDPCKKKEDPCKKKDNAGKKKEDPCKKKEDPCKKKEDPCKKKEDPCKKKDDAGKKKEDPCKKKEDDSKKKEDPCKKKDDSGKKNVDPKLKALDDCLKTQKSKQSIKQHTEKSDNKCQKEDPCKKDKKENPCKKKEDPCKKDKKEDPCKKDKKEDPCKKKEDPCKKKKEDPCKKKSAEGMGEKGKQLCNMIAAKQSCDSKPKQQDVCKKPEEKKLFCGKLLKIEQTKKSEAKSCGKLIEQIEAKRDPCKSAGEHKSEPCVPCKHEDYSRKSSAQDPCKKSKSEPSIPCKGKTREKSAALCTKNENKSKFDDCKVTLCNKTAKKESCEFAMNKPVKMMKKKKSFRDKYPWNLLQMGKECLLSMTSKQKCKPTSAASDPCLVPLGKPNPLNKTGSDLCASLKAKEDQCEVRDKLLKKFDEQLKKDATTVKTSDSLCKKENLCGSKVHASAKKTEDPCKKKEEDPCKKKKEDPCKKNEDPCKKKEDPCKKKEEDPCKKKEEDPCKKKEDPCKKKEEDPCKKKKEDPCKKQEDPCKKKEDPCRKSQNMSDKQCKPIRVTPSLKGITPQPAITPKAVPVIDCARQYNFFKRTSVFGICTEVLMNRNVILGDFNCMLFRIAFHTTADRWKSQSNDPDGNVEESQQDPYKERIDFYKKQKKRRKSACDLFPKRRKVDSSINILQYCQQKMIEQEEKDYRTPGKQVKESAFDCLKYSGPLPHEAEDVVTQESKRTCSAEEFDEEARKFLKACIENVKKNPALRQKIIGHISRTGNNVGAGRGETNPLTDCFRKCSKKSPSRKYDENICQERTEYAKPPIDCVETFTADARQASYSRPTNEECWEDSTFGPSKVSNVDDTFRPCAAKVGHQKTRETDESDVCEEHLTDYLKLCPAKASKNNSPSACEDIVKPPEKMNNQTIRETNDSVCKQDDDGHDGHSKPLTDCFNICAGKASAFKEPTVGRSKKSFVDDICPKESAKPLAEAKNDPTCEQDDDGRDDDFKPLTDCSKICAGKSPKNNYRQPSPPPCPVNEKAKPLTEAKNDPPCEQGDDSRDGDFKPLTDCSKLCAGKSPKNNYRQPCAPPCPVNKKADIEKQPKKCDKDTNEKAKDNKSDCSLYLEELNREISERMMKRAQEYCKSCKKKSDTTRNNELCEREKKTEEPCAPKRKKEDTCDRNLEEACEKPKQAKAKTSCGILLKVKDKKKCSTKGSSKARDAKYEQLKECLRKQKETSREQQGEQKKRMKSSKTQADDAPVLIQCRRKSCHKPATHNSREGGNDCESNATIPKQCRKACHKPATNNAQEGESDCKSNDGQSIVQNQCKKACHKLATSNAHKAENNCKSNDRQTVRQKSTSDDCKSSENEKIGHEECERANSDDNRMSVHNQCKKVCQKRDPSTVKPGDDSCRSSDQQSSLLNQCKKACKAPAPSSEKTPIKELPAESEPKKSAEKSPKAYLQLKCPPTTTSEFTSKDPCSTSGKSTEQYLQLKCPPQCTEEPPETLAAAKPESAIPPKDYLLLKCKSGQLDLEPYKKPCKETIEPCKDTTEKPPVKKSICGKVEDPPEDFEPCADPTKQIPCEQVKGALSAAETDMTFEHPTMICGDKCSAKAAQEDSECCEEEKNRHRQRCEESEAPPKDQSIQKGVKDLTDFPPGCERTEMKDMGLLRQCFLIVKNKRRPVIQPVTDAEVERSMKKGRKLVCKVQKIGLAEKLVCDIEEENGCLKDPDFDEEGVEKFLKCAVVRDKNNCQKYICTEILPKEAQKQLEAQRARDALKGICPKSDGKVKVISNKLVCRNCPAPDGSENKEMVCSVARVEEIKTLPDPLKRKCKTKKKSKKNKKQPKPVLTYNELLQKCRERSKKDNCSNSTNDE